MSDDVRADARRLLQGITPGKWRHCTGPAEGESKAEYLAGCLTNADESLHVVIAQSPAPEYAYVIPALTGDGPTSDANAEFIAAAPTLVDRLLAELDQAKADARLNASALYRSLADVRRAAGVIEDIDDLDYVLEVIDGHRRRLDAALATLQQVRELRDDYLADNNEHRTRIGLRHPIAGIAADHLTRILDGGTTSGGEA